MSKRAIVTFLFMALGLIVLSGCTPCDMVAPDLVGPDWRDILSGDLSWSYSDSCEPDHFEIVLAADASFSPIEHTVMVSGSSTSWTPTGLDDAREYYWKVRAEDEGDYGPWSSEFRSFFTGPVCDAADLVAPMLDYPSYGGVYDNASESLEWSWPLEGTCIPEAYRVEVSMTKDMSDTTYNGGTGTPGTRWGFGSTPPEGTQFWWRITASVDDFDYGPPSAPLSMFWTAPACAAHEARANLLLPLHHDRIDDLTPIFEWEYEYPGGSPCAPEGFHFQLSTTSDFSALIIDDVISVPATSSSPAAPLADCHEYWWRVDTISDGVATAHGAAKHFILEAGDCDCTETTLPAPILRSPDPFEVFPDTNAYIRWENPGGCFPDGHDIQLADDPFFEDNTHDSYVTEGLGITVGYEPSGLNPATQYWTKVAFSVEDSGGVPTVGPYSSTRGFFTGPECASVTELTAPVLDLPAEGAVVDTLTPMLRYHPEDPGCIPDEYFINLQTDPAFGGTNELGSIPLPSTAVLTDPLIDCTMYYWKVNGVQGGADGPESAVGSFYVNETGTCLPPGLPGTAKSNNFCRRGTFPEHFEALATIEEGDKVLAIARNPFSTYLLMNILDQETSLPYKYEINCWSYFEHFDLMGSIEELPIKNPPPTPTPTPIVCHNKLNEEDCKAAGGTYDQNKKGCYCP